MLQVACVPVVEQREERVEKKIQLPADDFGSKLKMSHLQFDPILSAIPCNLHPVSDASIGRTEPLFGCSASWSSWSVWLLIVFEIIVFL